MHKHAYTAIAQLGGVGQAFETTPNGNFYKYVFKHIPGTVQMSDEDHGKRLGVQLHGKKIYLAPGEDPAHWTLDEKNPVGQGHWDTWTSGGGATLREGPNAEKRGGGASIKIAVARVIHSAVFPNELSHGTMERKSLNLFLC